MTQAHSRDNVRASIFAAKHARPKGKIIPFFGTEIELRQPTVAQIQAYSDNEDKKSSLVNTLIEYAYVPGTGDKVFDEADADALKALPYNEDMQAVVKAVESLFNVQVTEAEKN